MNNNLIWVIWWMQQTGIPNDEIINGMIKYKLYENFQNKIDETVAKKKNKIDSIMRQINQLLEELQNEFNDIT